MSKLSRRSIVSTILPATVLGLILPSRTKASDQSHMRDAQEALRKAKRELQDADNDKGGHRNRALRLVDQALDEVEKGIRFDRRH